MNEVIAIGVDLAKNVFQVHGVDTALVDRLKALDPERPIREADIGMDKKRRDMKRPAFISSHSLYYSVFL